MGIYDSTDNIKIIPHRHACDLGNLSLKLSFLVILDYIKLTIKKLIVLSQPKKRDMFLQGVFGWIKVGGNS